MKFEINGDDMLTIIIALRETHLNRMKLFTESPELTIGLSTPEDIAETYNRFLGQVHEQGDLAMFTPMRTKKYDVNLN